MEISQYYELTFNSTNASFGGLRYQDDDYVNALIRAVCHINFVLMIIGVFVNILCIFVFRQKHMKRRKFNLYLFILAILELVFCLIVSIDYLCLLINKKLLHEINQYTNMIFDYLIHSIDSYVVILTLILSTDRFYAIKYPTKIKSFFTNSHSKLLLISAFIGLLLVKLPGIIFCYENSEYSKPLQIVYCTIISHALSNVIPTICILIINSLLIFGVVSYYRRKAKLEKKSTEWKLSTIKAHRTPTVYIRCVNYKPVDRFKKSHYLVIIILAVWAVFTTIPYYLFNTFFLFFNLFLIGPSNIKTFRILQIISSVFFNSNHCINFFIYFFFYDEFRFTIVKKMFCNLRLKKKLNKFKYKPQLLKQSEI